MQLHTGLFRDLVHKAVDIILRRGDSSGRRRRVLVVSSRDIEVFELAFEFVHDCRNLKSNRQSNVPVDVLLRVLYLLQIHGLHCGIHSLDYIRHTARHLAHGYGGLYSAADCIDSGAETKEIEAFVLLADGILGVDSGDVGVVLLDRLFDALL